MAVTIKKLGVEVPGRVLRTFDGENTQLELDEAQARKLHDELSTVMSFFDTQASEPADTGRVLLVHTGD